MEPVTKLASGWSYGFEKLENDLQKQAWLCTSVVASMHSEKLQFYGNDELEKRSFVGESTTYLKRYPQLRDVVLSEEVEYRICSWCWKLGCGNYQKKATNKGYVVCGD